MDMVFGNLIAADANLRVGSRGDAVSGVGLILCRVRAGRLDGHIAAGDGGGIVSGYDHLRTLPVSRALTQNGIHGGHVIQDSIIDGQAADEGSTGTVLAQPQQESPFNLKRAGKAAAGDGHIAVLFRIHTVHITGNFAASNGHGAERGGIHRIFTGNFTAFDVRGALDEIQTKHLTGDFAAGDGHGAVFSVHTDRTFTAAGNGAVITGVGDGHIRLGTTDFALDVQHT